MSPNTDIYDDTMLGDLLHDHDIKYSLPILYKWQLYSPDIHDDAILLHIPIQQIYHKLVIKDK